MLSPISLGYSDFPCLRFRLCFPFGKLPLPLLALEKRLYLREQDAEPPRMF